jgi:hypothetical protein
MSARVRPTPVEQMRERLEVARGRRTRFEQAWAHAMRTITFPSDWAEAQAWRDVLNATVDEWRAAYLGESPSPFGSACGLLAAA